jgi:hypothetical protein
MSPRALTEAERELALGSGVWAAGGYIGPPPSPNQVIGQDPNGKDQHEPGAKLDAGKPRAALVLGDFSRALSAVTDVGTYGAAKYTDHGWITVPDGVQRYSDAMMRHWLDESAGIACDRETNLLHAAHLAWNALARLELMLLQREPKE